MKINVIDIAGKKVGEKDVALGLITQEDAKDHLFYLVNNYQRAYLRAGTASTKRRSEVSGGGKKPYKQKGTGNARRGTSRTPLRPGGGVVFGPKPRSFKQNLNVGVIKKAFQHAFALKEGQLFVLENASASEIKTGLYAGLFNALSKDAKNVSLIALPESNSVKSCRNIKNCSVFQPSFILLEKLLNGDCVVITEDAFNKIEEMYIR